MPPKKAPSKAPSAAGDVSSALNKLVSSYKNTTPVRLKLLDAFLLFLFVTGIAQFVYCVLISNYPFNSFIAGYVNRLTQLRLDGWPVRPDSRSAPTVGSETPLGREQGDAGTVRVGSDAAPLASS